MQIQILAQEVGLHWRRPLQREEVTQIPDSSPSSARGQPSSPRTLKSKTR